MCKSFSAAEKRPGCCLFIGNGEGNGSCMVHDPGYDFDDQHIAIGSADWVLLAEPFLRSPAG